MKAVQLTPEQLRNLLAKDGNFLQNLWSHVQDHEQNLTDVQKLEAWLLQQNTDPCDCVKCLALSASHFLQTYLAAGRTEEQAKACITYMNDVEEAITARDDALKDKIIHGFAVMMAQV
jgi:hypothetical protein